MFPCFPPSQIGETETEIKGNVLRPPSGFSGSTSFSFLVDPRTESILKERRLLIGEGKWVPLRVNASWGKRRTSLCYHRCMSHEPQQRRQNLGSCNSSCSSSGSGTKKSLALTGCHHSCYHISIGPTRSFSFNVWAQCVITRRVMVVQPGARSLSPFPLSSTQDGTLPTSLGPKDLTEEAQKLY